MSPDAPDSLLDRFDALAAAAPLRARLGVAGGVYLVGGATRDLLLGRDPRELDLVVDGDLEALIGRLGVRTRHHARFGTCTVELDGFSYDFARARRESYASPGALPEVSPAGLEEDLRRRDFTVNAIAMALGGAEPGRVVAADGALEDLRGRRLRILHDRSFVDDPTRLLRLVRYATRLGFGVEPGTLELARTAVDGGALRTVSGSRIGAELQLLMREPEPLAPMVELRELGIDAALTPGFGLADPSLARRALEILPEDGDGGLLVMAAAAIRVAAEPLARLLGWLAFPASLRDTVLAAALGAEPIAIALAAARRPSEIAAAVAGAPVEAVALAAAMGPAQAGRDWLQRWRAVGLLIDGRDLLEAGVPAGPAVGAGLRAALAARLDGRADGREAQLAEALRPASGNE